MVNTGHVKTRSDYRALADDLRGMASRMPGNSSDRILTSESAKAFDRAANQLDLLRHLAATNVDNSKAITEAVTLKNGGGDVQRDTERIDEQDG